MTGPVVVDGRVPGYLGRVLDEDGIPAGTCFQVAPGVLVTAWHVLSDLGAADEGDRVQVDPLGGGAAFDARVARADTLRDLAVVTCEAQLAGVAGRLAATDDLPLRALVSVTGHAVPDDPGHCYRFLVAPGEWAGGTTRDDAVPLGRMTSTGVVRGMSGAPVVRDTDGMVVGVVSGRYNSADGWLEGTVWVARAEDLAALLEGIAEVPLTRAPLAGPADLLLEVTADRVRLAGPGGDAVAGHSGVRPGLAEAVNEIRRDRGRAGLPARADAADPASGELVSLGRAGRLLGESFLPAPVAEELGRVLTQAEAAHQPVRLGLAVPQEWAGLPWEALPGPDGAPLALHPLVSVYRKTQTTQGRRLLGGPLRIVVAIASPENGSGPLLDYEKELRNVLAAVRAARADAADVRVVPFATPAAIRAELDHGPAHVLHITGHGSPGLLHLETQDGTGLAVTADEFCDQAIPPGRMPPVITLAACYTDAAGAQDGVSFAARLCQHGASAVIATETSITDTYATRLLARLYGTLAQAADPDVIAALSQARRQVQAELETSGDPRDQVLAGLGEWAAVTVLAASGEVPVLDPGQAAAAARRPSRPRVPRLAGREDWYFVGRRAEQRRWPAEMTAPAGVAGIVVCGIGGAGKTTLAAEVVTRVRDREPGRILAGLAGPLTLESLLGTVAATIRRELLAVGSPDAATIAPALEVVMRADVGWQDRYAILRDHVLDRVPVLVLLDNFEDNLRSDGATWQVADEALGGLLGAWAADPGRSRLLVTCRYRFTLPGDGHQRLSFRQLGPLSRAETMKLAWSLPALDQLDATELAQVWRLVGGHPRSLEYLDALLSGGTARYPDVTSRLHAAVTARLDREQDLGRWLADRTGLDAALAETVTLAADDVLLEDLLTRLDQMPGTADLLLGVSVYREPVDRNAVLFQAGRPDPDAEHIPDRAAAYEQITGILAAAGITVDESFDPATVPDLIRVQLAPHVAELERRPTPPFRAVPDLQEQIAACQAASLLGVSDDGDQPLFFVHRWTATELARRLEREAELHLANAHRRAAEYWLWRAKGWPQDGAAYIDDLLEARYHMLQSGDTEGADHITEDICLQLHTGGAWDQEASLIHDSLRRLAAESPRRATWFHQLGTLAHDRGDYDEAVREHQRALDIREPLGDQVGIASSYYQLGNVAYMRGDYDEAARQYQRALDIREPLGDQIGIAASYHQLGMLAHDRGDYDEAARQYQRALDIDERIGSQAGMATCYRQLGMLAHDRGDYDEAARQYQRALDIRERLGDQAGMATSYHQLGVLAHDRGDYDEAARQYQRALDIDERIGSQAGMAACYQQLGVLAHDRGDYDEAARQYQRALDIHERVADPGGMANSYGQLGMLARDRGDYDEAARQYQRGLEIFERLGDPVGTATSYHNLGMLAGDRGDYEEAARQYQRALAIRERLGDQVGVATSYHNLGGLAYRRGDYDEAARQFQRGLEIFERISDQASMAAAYHNFGMLAGNRGDYEEAARQYQRALAIRERLGDQVGIASTYTRLGELEEERGGSTAAVITWHVKALMIRLRLRVPQAGAGLRRLHAYRCELGTAPFTDLLTQAAGDIDMAAKITLLLDLLDKTDGSTA